MRPESPNVGRPFATESASTSGSAKPANTPPASSVRIAAARTEAPAIRHRQKALNRKTNDNGNIAAFARYPRPSSAPKKANTDKFPRPRWMRSSSAVARKTTTLRQRSGITHSGPSQKKLDHRKKRYPHTNTAREETRQIAPDDSPPPRRPRVNSLRKTSNDPKLATYTAKFSRCAAVNSHCAVGWKSRKTRLNKKGYSGLQYALTT